MLISYEISWEIVRIIPIKEQLEFDDHLIIMIVTTLNAIHLSIISTAIFIKLNEYSSGKTTHVTNEQMILSIGANIYIPRFEL